MLIGQLKKSASTALNISLGSRPTFQLPARGKLSANSTGHYPYWRAGRRGKSPFRSFISTLLFHRSFYGLLTPPFALVLLPMLAIWVLIFSSVSSHLTQQITALTHDQTWSLKIMPDCLQLSALLACLFFSYSFILLHLCISSALSNLPTLWNSTSTMWLILLSQIIFLGSLTETSPVCTIGPLCKESQHILYMIMERACRLRHKPLSTWS